MAKKLFITGASSGIGLSLCKHILRLYPQIDIIANCRSVTPLTLLAQRFPNRVQIIQADITSESGRENVFSALKLCETIDYIVHSAAVITPLSRLTDITTKQWQTTQKTNLEAPLFLTLGMMDKLENSRVMFLTADSELQPVMGAASYCMSKMGLHMAWACLKAEVPIDKAAFALVAPGNVDTPMQAKIRNADPEQLPMAPVLKQFYEQGKLLNADFVAQFLSWLLTEIDAHPYQQKTWNIYAELENPHWQTGK